MPISASWNSPMWGWLHGLDISTKLVKEDIFWRGYFVPPEFKWLCLYLPSRSAPENSCLPTRQTWRWHCRTGKQTRGLIRRLRITWESTSGYSERVPTQKTGAKLRQGGPLSGDERRRVEVAEEHDWFMGWLASCERTCLCVCVRAGHRVDDRLARPRMGQAPSAPQAAVMCPFSLRSPQPGQTRAVRVIACACRCFFIVSFPVTGVLFRNQSHKSLYLPSTIKVKVCLGGTVTERQRQLTL